MLRQTAKIDKRGAEGNYNQAPLNQCVSWSLHVTKEGSPVVKQIFNIFCRIVDYNFANLKDLSNQSLGFGENFQQMDFAVAVMALARNKLQMKKGNKYKTRRILDILYSAQHGNQHKDALA